MHRTLNFTGRQRLLRTAARISLRRDPEGVVLFDAELALSSFGFPADSKVFIEAFFKASFMRFDFGTVARLTPPADRRLLRLTQPGLARYRVKVVAPMEQGPGLLLGVADYIAPEGVSLGERRQVPLLRVDVKQDLGQEIWRLDLDNEDGAGPILELNAEVTGIKEIARREPYFLSLVFPDVMRRIWRHICEDGGHSGEEDRHTWQSRWLRYGAGLVGEPIATLTGGKLTAEQEEWIDRAVDTWSRRRKLLVTFKKNHALSNEEGRA